MSTFPNIQQVEHSNANCQGIHCSNDVDIMKFLERRPGAQVFGGVHEVPECCGANACQSSSRVVSDRCRRRSGEFLLAASQSCLNCKTAYEVIDSFVNTLMESRESLPLQIGSCISDKSQICSSRSNLVQRYLVIFYRLQNFRLQEALKLTVNP